MAWGFERGCLQRLFYLCSSESSKGLRRSEPNTFSISRQRISSSSNDIVSNNSITSFLSTAWPYDPTPWPLYSLAILITLFEIKTLY